MKKTSILGYGILLTSLLASCSFSFSSDPSGASSKSSSSSSAPSTSSSASPTTSLSSVSSSEDDWSDLAQPSDAALVNSDEYRAFWNHHSDIKIRLTVSNQVAYDLSRLQGNHDDTTYDDLYFPAAFHLELNEATYDLDNVGIRLKGNLSRRYFVEEDGTITQTAHFKISFKATFDDDLYTTLSGVSQYKVDWSNDAVGYAARKKRTLFGMEKLDLKYTPRNTVEGKDGESNSQEIYCYDAFRKEGLIAPHANLVQTNFLDAKNGITYTAEAVECIDKVFLKRNFNKAESKGDLYKCVYGKMGQADLYLDNAVSANNGVYTRIADGKIGCEDNVNGYHPSYDLSTNDDAGNSGTFASMSNFIGAIYDVTHKSAAQSVLESALDVQEFLKFSAVSYLFGNPDDQRYNANNYYIYFLPSTGKAIYLPYDWDWSLGLTYDKDYSSVSPFDETTGGAHVPYIYYATFYSSKSVNYSRSAYRSAYSGYIAAALKDGLLDYGNYSRIAGEMKYASKSELSIVKTYMTAKSKAAA